MRLEFEYSEYGDSYHEPVDYGDWWTTNHRTYDYAYITDSQYGGHPIDFPVSEGDTVYLLYVTYSSGDSFGNASGCVEEIWVFNNPNDAEKARRIIEEDANKNPDTTSDLDIGLPRPIYTGAWKGYFDYVEDVTVVPLVVRKGR
jgi:hypothetical protein